MAERQKRFRIELWSMLFFLLPFALAVAMRFWVGVAVILASSATSIAYHITKSMKVFYVDRVCAILLIALCWACAILGHFPSPYFLITLVLGAISLGIYFNQEHPPAGYRTKHAIWHVLSAFVVTLSLIMYIVGTLR
jgi:hypothetical protein